MLGLLVAVSTGLAADLDRGARLYRTRCRACHGRTLAGDGPAAAAIEPPPTNLADPAWWDGRDEDSIRVVIRAGKPGTAMMAFDQMTAQDTDLLIAYLRSVAVPNTAAEPAEPPLPEPPLEPQP